MSKLKENLYTLRKDKGLTQEDLAQYLKLSRPAYNRYENGNAEPTIERLIMLADFYNVSLDELVGREYKQDSESMRNILLKKQIDTEIKGVIKETVKELIESKEDEIKQSVFEKFKLK